MKNQKKDNKNKRLKILIIVFKNFVKNFSLFFRINKMSKLIGKNKF